MIRAIKLNIIKPGDNADRAGLRAGDILVLYDRQRVADNNSLLAAIQRTVGRTQAVTLQVVRDGELLDFNVDPGPLGAVTGEIAMDEPVPPDNRAEGKQGSESTIKVALPDTIKAEVVDISMPFFSMVGFMVKWSLASIPAFIILFALFVTLFAVFGSLFHR